MNNYFLMANIGFLIGNVLMLCVAIDIRAKARNNLGLSESKVSDKKSDYEKSDLQKINGMEYCIGDLLVVCNPDRFYERQSFEVEYKKIVETKRIILEENKIRTVNDVEHYYGYKYKKFYSPDNYIQWIEENRVLGKVCNKCVDEK